MPQLIEQRNYTIEEYLEFEVNSEERHEYIDGEVVCVRGTPNHNKIAGNLYAALNFGLKRQPYDVFVTDQRLWIPQKRIYTYPDVMVIAHPIEYQETRRDTLVNPLLIAEVLSNSTQNYDRGEKFLAYRSIPTLQEYILIDQYSIHVEHFCKTDRNRWTLTEFEDANETLEMQTIPLQMVIADLYDKVEFEAE
jgi:Uma2 family endonuclease